MGYDEGGQLTEAIRRRLDDGRLTDGKSPTVDFRNTVVIMTGNVGSDVIQESSRRGDDDEKLKTKLMEVLRHTFRPEFLNRVDETVISGSARRDAIVWAARKRMA